MSLRNLTGAISDAEFLKVVSQLASESPENCKAQLVDLLASKAAAEEKSWSAKAERPPPKEQEVHPTAEADAPLTVVSVEVAEREAPVALKHPAPATVKEAAACSKRNSPLRFLEVNLPSAAESHELCFEPTSRYVLLSQMTSSVLVRVKVGPDGLLLERELEAFRIGVRDEETLRGVEGLHNISLSYKHPGCVWLTLQFSNSIVLLDVASMEVKQVLRCPTNMGQADGSILRIGGPHCVRECPLSGGLWVALKGAISCHPAVLHDDVPQDRALDADGNVNPEVFEVIMERLKHGGEINPMKIYCAEAHDCCSNAFLQTAMAKLEARGFDTPLPEAFAVWHVEPAAYDPAVAAGGGRLFPCEPSPPMVAIDGRCNCWVAQDQRDMVMHVDARSGETKQVKVPLPEGCRKITGPSIATAPDGALWVVLLGGASNLVRIDPTTFERTLYDVGTPDWCKKLNFIHLLFAPKELGHSTPHTTCETVRTDFTNRAPERMGAHCHRLYLLSSDLVDNGAMNALVVLLFDDTWRTVLARKVVPLPTQGCACHRLELIHQGLPAEQHSVVISELTMAKMLQIQTGSLVSFVTPVVETISRMPMDCPSVPVSDEGIEVRAYAAGPTTHNY